MIPAHEVHGSGPALVLSHGVIESSESWADAAHRLEDRFTSVRYDARGRGRTPAPTAFTYADLAADVEELARELELDGFFHAGHSMGGRVALEHAVRFPGRVRAVAAVSARAEAPDEAGRQRLREQAAIARGSGPGDAIGMWTRPADPHYERVREISSRNPAEGTATALESLAGMDSLLDRLPEIAIPVLLVAGENDPNYVRSARLMAERIAQAEVAILPGVGHFPNLEAPAELAELLASFFGSVQPAVNPAIRRGSK